MSTVNKDVSVRSVEAEAAPLLASIHQACFPHYWHNDTFTDFFSVRGTHALLAERDGMPVAMVVYRVLFEQADIITIAVLPEYRRQGMARDLLRQAMEAARQAGAAQMFLDVEDGNIPAIQLYNAYGFTLLKRRRLYYRQKDGSHTDALVMKCKLA